MLAGTPCDLVIAEAGIADMDGYRLAREIRRRHGAVPVVLLSSGGALLHRLRGMLAGCKACLTRPVRSRRFAAAVMKALRKPAAGCRPSRYPVGHLADPARSL